MKSEQLFEGEWDQCPPGTLRGFAVKQRRQKQVRWLAVGSGALVALLLIGVSLRGYLLPDSATREPNFGGVTCSVVQSKIQLYHEQKLDPALTASIRQHLAECSHCRRDLLPPATTQFAPPQNLVVWAEVVP